MLGAAGSQTTILELQPLKDFSPGFYRVEVTLLDGQGREVVAQEVLLPLAGDQEPPGEVLALLGQAYHALGEYQGALNCYAGYLSRFGPQVDILNFLGTCYYQLGNKEEALKAWTKSLELSPNQERIKKLLDSLKNK